MALKLQGAAGDMYICIYVYTKRDRNVAEDFFFLT